MFPAAIFDQSAGDIVAKSFTVLSAVAGRQAIAGFIKELTLQRGSGCLLSGATSNRCASLKHALNHVPNRRLNDGWMLSLVDLFLVSDSPSIDRVAQNVLKVTLVDVSTT